MDWRTTVWSETSGKGILPLEVALSCSDLRRRPCSRRRGGGRCCESGHDAITEITEITEMSGRERGHVLSRPDTNSCKLLMSTESNTEIYTQNLKPCRSTSRPPPGRSSRRSTPSCASISRPTRSSAAGPPSLRGMVSRICARQLDTRPGGGHRSPNFGLRVALSAGPAERPGWDLFRRSFTDCRDSILGQHEDDDAKYDFASDNTLDRVQRALGF